LSAVLLTPALVVILLGPVVSYDFNGDGGANPYLLNTGHQTSAGDVAVLYVYNTQSFTTSAKGWLVTTVGCF
jgi:hypothetical protein